MIFFFAKKLWKKWKVSLFLFSFFYSPKYKIQEIRKILQLLGFGGNGVVCRYVSSSWPSQMVSIRRPERFEGRAGKPPKQKGVAYITRRQIAGDWMEAVLIGVVDGLPPVS